MNLSVFLSETIEHRSLMYRFITSTVKNHKISLAYILIALPVQLLRPQGERSYFIILTSWLFLEDLLHCIQERVYCCHVFCCCE